MVALRATVIATKTLGRAMASVMTATTFAVAIGMEATAADRWEILNLPTATTANVWIAGSKLRVTIAWTQQQGLAKKLLGLLMVSVTMATTMQAVIG